MGLKISRRTYETRGQKVRDFLIGFGGWFLGNGLVLLIVVLTPFGLIALQDAGTGLPDSAAGLVVFALPCLWGLLNLAALVYFGLTRLWVALGGVAYFVAGFALFICFSLTLPFLPSLV
jgi:hypothetical protein